MNHHKDHPPVQVISLHGPYHDSPIRNPTPQDALDLLRWFKERGEVEPCICECGKDFDATNMSYRDCTNCIGLGWVKGEKDGA